MLYIQFRTWKDALIVLGTLPFGAIGGVLTLFLTRTNFSISAAVGFTSLTGAADLLEVSPRQVSARVRGEPTRLDAVRRGWPVADRR